MKHEPQSRFTDCPCCQGEGILWLHDASYPDDPPQRVVCCHCGGEGIVGCELPADERPPVRNALAITDTTASTSRTTGALTVAGGLQLAHRSGGAE